jgi:hypothetical protein
MGPDRDSEVHEVLRVPADRPLVDTEAVGQCGHRPYAAGLKKF